MRPVLRVGMPRAPRQGPAGRGQGADNSWQVAAGSWQQAEGTAEPSNRRTAVPLYCRTVEPSYCRTAVEHERNDRSRQRTIGDKNGRVLQTERRAPGRCPRCPLDHPARHGPPSLHGALRPPAGPPKNQNHALPRSRGYARNGVRYLSMSVRFPPPALKINRLPLPRPTRYPPAFLSQRHPGRVPRSLAESFLPDYGLGPLTGWECTNRRLLGCRECDTK